MKLRYTPQARSGLEEIHSYIAQDNPVAARKAVAAIRRDVTLLIDNPGLGRPGRVAGTRELVIARLPFVAAYRIHGRFIEVLAVIHTARDWPNSFYTQVGVGSSPNLNTTASLVGHLQAFRFIDRANRRGGLAHHRQRHHDASRRRPTRHLCAPEPAHGHATDHQLPSHRPVAWRERCSTPTRDCGSGLGRHEDPADADWEQQIRQHVPRARIMIMLASDDYFDPAVSGAADEVKSNEQNHDSTGHHDNNHKDPAFGRNEERRLGKVVFVGDGLKCGVIRHACSGQTAAGCAVRPPQTDGASGGLECLGYSKRQAKAIVEVIDCAIGMKKDIGDDAAIVFAAAFYRKLGFGASVRKAFDEGRVALMLQGIPEDKTPELLVKRGVDANQIFLTTADANPS